MHFHDKTVFHSNFNVVFPVESNKRIKCNKYGCTLNDVEIFVYQIMNS